PEQADADRLDAPLAKPSDDGESGVFVERLYDPSPGIDALGYLESEAPWHIGFGEGDRVVEGLAPTALAVEQDVGMTLRREKSRPRRALREDGIGGPGGCVEEHLRATKEFRERGAVGRCRRAQHLEHSHDGILRRRGRLEELKGTRLNLGDEV